MNVQIIKNKDEVEWAVIPYDEYIQLVEKAEMLDDIQDFDSFQIALAQGEEQLFPVEVVDKLLEGHNPIKVFREFREMTQDNLAKKIDISIPYLSQLETNKRRGSIKVLTDIAKELGISLEMILINPE
ncbi:MAG: XRE family transcriptional regulator [Chloroflexi bacterium HGW-Chloroflexi-3]|nr:MAG: XRE family transcriptional regulator [Chloroflexi bacterium HGW-Chloroflexi-3]